MSHLRSIVKSVLVPLLLCPFAFAAKNVPPQTWWPDPSSGLMWTANASQASLDLQGAKDHCKNLDYAGFSDWRLPDIAELESAVIITLHVRNARDPNRNPGFDLAADTTLPHGAFRWNETFVVTAWSSTPASPGEAFSINLGDNPLTGSSKITAKGGHYAFCTRNMGSDLLQMAKEANMQTAVLDARELQIYVWLGRSRADTAAGNYPGAVEAAKQALLLSPNSFVASNILAQTYTSQGQWDQAISAYQAVPDNRYLKSELKRIANQQKESSNDPSAITAIGYMSQSKALIEQGKFMESIVASTRATQLEPQWSEAFCQLGTAQSDQSQWIDARATLQTALKLDKNSLCAEKALDSVNWSLRLFDGIQKAK